MCRLLALRSESPRAVSGPLLTASNALLRQSTEHPDGWGIANLQDGKMQLLRAPDAAHASVGFRDYAKKMRSELLVAHIRKASVGGNRIENTHPFVHDGWVFAHNGTVRKFDERRASFEKRIAPKLRAELTGDTDSERCFFFFLTELRKQRGGEPMERAAQALATVARFTRESDPPGLPRASVANFVATDGDALVALRFGKMLHVAAGGGGEALRDGAQLRELFVSSEPFDAKLPWRLLQHGQGVAIDKRMVLRRFSAR